MVSLILVVIIVMCMVIVAALVFVGLKYRKRYLAILKRRSRKQWKDTHQKSLRGNFVLTYDSPIEEKYYIEKRSKLGQGSFGVVVLGTHKETGNQYAIKFINKSSEERRRLERELRILKDVDHPNIVGLFAVYDTDEQVGFVMELCSGGHMGRFLEKQQDNHLTERHAQIIIRQLLSAVTHMHSRGICHRDIKLQNILMENSSPDAQIKLIDFGFGTRFIGATPLHTRCGTPYTTAPEVFRECYDERCDVWSVGVVAFIAICGRRPFESLVIPGELEDAGKTNLVTNILLCRYHFNHRQWKRVSPLAIDFVQKMMHPDYKSRWSAKTALVHEWLELGEPGPVDVTQLTSSKGLDRVLDNLRRTSFMSSLHLTSMLAVVFSQPNSRTDDMRSLFQNFDTDHNGTLSKDEFTLALQHMSSGTISPALADQLFDNIDANHDKQISFSEFLAATLDPREVQISELNKAFELLDLEKKGYITVDDLARVLDANASRSHGRLSRTCSLSYRDTSLKEAADQFEDRRDGNKPLTRMFGLVNVGIPILEGNSQVSVEDSEFSHSQELSGRRYLSAPHAPSDKFVHAKAFSKLQPHGDEDDEEDLEAQLPATANTGSRRGSTEPADLESMDPKLAQRINDILTTCDTNGDGVISYSEFLWAMADGDGLFNNRIKLVDDDDDSDDEVEPAPMLKRRGSSMPIIKQDELAGREKARVTTAAYMVDIRRNSSATGSLNIQHVKSTGGEIKMDDDCAIPFGHPEALAIVRQRTSNKPVPYESIGPSPSSSLRVGLSRTNSGASTYDPLERWQSMSSPAVGCCVETNMADGDIPVSDGTRAERDVVQTLGDHSGTGNSVGVGESVDGGNPDIGVAGQVSRPNMDAAPTGRTL